MRGGALLAWFGEQQRDLPWRRTRDPWSILVSELMLQQTQVARAAEVPGVRGAVAHAGRLRSRAPGRRGHRLGGAGLQPPCANLHRCAVAVTEVHGGMLPDDLAGLLALPGIGPYTARAVLAFAHEETTWACSTPTPPGSWPAGRGARSGGPRPSSLPTPRAAGSGAGRGTRPCSTWAPPCAPRAPPPAVRRLPGGPAWCAWRARGNAAPDPAVGSAGVSGGQSAFAGSDRQGRGRLVDALRRGPVVRAEVAAAMGWADDPARADRVAASVVADGLATFDEETETYRLPREAPVTKSRGSGG